MLVSTIIMPSPRGGGAGALSGCRRLSVRLSDVAYIGSNSKTKTPRKTKLCTGVPQVTCDSHIDFKVKRSKVKVSRGGGILWRPPSRTACLFRCDLSCRLELVMWITVRLSLNNSFLKLWLSLYVSDRTLCYAVEMSRCYRNICWNFGCFVYPSRTLMPLYDSDTGMLFLAGKVCPAIINTAFEYCKMASVDRSIWTLWCLWRLYFVS